MCHEQQTLRCQTEATITHLEQLQHIKQVGSLFYDSFVRWQLTQASFRSRCDGGKARLSRACSTVSNIDSNSSP